MESGTAKIGEVISNRNFSPGQGETGIRVVMYAHDTFGLGHLQRCLKISRVLTDRFPQVSVLLVTGSPVSHKYQFPPRVDYVKLPAVRKVGPEKYEPRTLTAPFETVLLLRSEIVLKSVQSFAPHIFLVDHSPVGMKGELLPTLNWLRTQEHNTVTILGLRDIIDSPEEVKSLWEEKGIYRVMENSYDHILIYGTQSIYDPVTAYGFSETLKKKSTFCNYVGDTAHTLKKTETRKGKSNKRPLVVVTIGGGDGAGETVIGNYIDAINLHKVQVDFDSVIMTGAFLPREQYLKYVSAVRNLPVSIKTFMQSTAALLKRSDLVIATGGYNTITDILGFAKRALVIPRVMHRQEQRIRATRLAELGIIEYMAPENVTPELLFSKIRNLLDNLAEPVTEARARKVIALDGASRLAEFVGKIFVSKNKLKEGGSL